MRKLIAVFLILLLLTGCGSGQPASLEGENQAPDQETAGTEPVGLYSPGSEAEQQSGGALRAYPLGDSLYKGLVAMEENLLVISAGGDVTALQGEQGLITATVATDLEAEWDALDLWQGNQSFAYYAPGSREVVILNTRLEEVERLQMPELFLENPVCCLSRNEIFYCFGMDIHAMDIQTGISRLVRSHNVKSQELIGSFFDDTILGCRIVDSQDAERILYLSTETGQVLGTDETMGELTTAGDLYFAQFHDGTMAQSLFGTADDEIMSLNVSGGTLLPVLERSGVIGCTVQGDDLKLEFYDLESGKCTSRVQLPNEQSIVASAVYDDCLWLLCYQNLYRWDLSASAVSDSTVYTSPLFTEDAPDTEGLTLCRERADGLLEQHGLNLLLWDAVPQQAGGYSIVQEYQVSKINAALDTMESICKDLPEGFLTGLGKLQFSLVNSLDNGETAAVYWSGGQCNVIVSCEAVERGFLWGLGYCLDSKLLGNSRQLDTWDSLNPKGFKYTYDYAENAQRDDAEDYLEGSGKAFVDLTSMSFPTEDRARIFAAAMLADNGNTFSTERMQNKLLRLCESIRSAYSLEDSTQVFPWEQYLDEALAKTEE